MFFGRVFERRGSREDSPGSHDNEEEGQGEGKRQSVIDSVLQGEDPFCTPLQITQTPQVGGRSISSEVLPSPPAPPPPLHATLKLPSGEEHQIKVLRGTRTEEGEKETLYLDIRWRYEGRGVGTGNVYLFCSDLYSKTGCFTYDPGFTCTASCASAITFIDGEKGKCLYRGYRVDVLAEKADFVEVAFLLLDGDLPTSSQKAYFKSRLTESMMVHEKFCQFFHGFQYGAHPMAIMMAVVAAMSAFYSEDQDWNKPKCRDLAALRVVGQVFTFAAMAYKTAIGQPYIYPKAELSPSENFLRMMFATPLKEEKVDPVFAKAIDKFLILHADHEQNASTATVRIAGSSQANPFACVSAGIASLWGPAHGGANEAVMKMLRSIGSVENVDEFIQDVKSKKEGVRLMGFGHRVYKNFDPRALYMKKLTKEVLSACGRSDDRLLKVAVELERRALEDPYFQQRKLYPNVDFYSGIMLKAVGIPESMYTVLFAMARTIGWITQWREMVAEQQMRIGRPRQLYVGPPERDFKEVEERGREDEEEEHRLFKRSLSSFRMTLQKRG